MNSEFRIQNPEPVGRRTARSFHYSDGFPKAETYGLSSQLRRAANQPSLLEKKLTKVSKLLEAYIRAIWNSNGESQRLSKRGILNSEF